MMGTVIVLVVVTMAMVADGNDEGDDSYDNSDVW